MIRIEFENCTAEVDADTTYELATHKIIRACQAVMIAAGYDADAFMEGMIDWLHNKNFVVLSDDEYQNALAEARAEGTPSPASQEDYDAGYNDGYNGEDAQEDQSPEYYDGYETGKEAFEAA